MNTTTNFLIYYINSKTNRRKAYDILLNREISGGTHDNFICFSAKIQTCFL